MVTVATTEVTGFKTVEHLVIKVVELVRASDMSVAAAAEQIVEQSKISGDEAQYLMYVGLRSLANDRLHTDRTRIGDSRLVVIQEGAPHPSTYERPTVKGLADIDIPTADGEGRTTLAKATQKDLEVYVTSARAQRDGWGARVEVVERIQIELKSKKVTRAANLPANVRKLLDKAAVSAWAR